MGVVIGRVMPTIDSELVNDGAARPCAVSIRAVSKCFGTMKVLQEVDLDIYKGEFFSLLGSSGCGKTTLLRIIGGFEQLTSGDVQIGGRSVLQDPPYRRRTNMIFQHLALFPHLTVAENIAFGLEMKKLDSATIARKVEDSLNLVHLPDTRDRRIDTLSGGQRQRIAMARALVNEPDVLLLDEPLGALDLQLRLHMQEELKRLHRETKRTFIFVTHDQTEAMTMSDRVAVMGAGRIIQVGTPQDVYERPNSRFVAKFMGHSNFIEGLVSQVEPDRAGSIDAQGTSFVCRLPPGVQPGQPVLFALRYERVEIAPATDAKATDLAGTVLSRSFTGATVRFEMKTSNGILFVADVSNAGPAFSPAVGEPVRIRWSPDAPVVLAD